MDSMKLRLTAAALALMVSAESFAGYAQNAAWLQSITQYIESQVNNGPLKGAVVGVCAMEIAGQAGNDARWAGNDGKVIAAYNSSTRMVPASNMKLVTTGAALRAFGPEYKFETGIGYKGSIGEDGTLHGDVYIIGGGDPTIGAADSTAYKAEALFWKWKTLLAEAGIKRIDGNVVGDGSAWEGGLENIGWEYGDVWTYYAAGSSALSFYENAIDLQVSAGAKVGDPVNMVQAYPETPWLQLENCGTTGPAGSGNSLLMQTSDLSPKAVLTGTYAINRRPKTERAANKYGALTCANEFYKNLLATGWEVTGTYKTGAGEKVTVIGHTQSPALAQICRKTNYDSDNFYAEALFRAMGEAATGIAVYDSCRVAINEVLEDITPGKAGGIIQKDGSGLSRADCISPEWMAGYLAAMSGNKAFVESLPRPGEGTITALKNLSPWRFRIKSGSMGGVLCYSGYVMDAEGKPVRSFAVMTNNLGCKIPEAMRSLEYLMLLLARSN